MQRASWEGEAPSEPSVLNWIGSDGASPSRRRTGMAANQQARAMNVAVSDDTLTVDLTDGRTISVPLLWYPRLSHATAGERKSWRLIADGEGIRWPDLDEDISVEWLLAGRTSGESLASFKKWLEARPQLKPKRKRTKP